jgi:integral membrane sensor domain MASE1
MVRMVPPGAAYRVLARAPRVSAALGLVGVYLLGLGAVLFAPPGSDVAVWWPAAGLGVAMLVLAPPRWRAWLALGIVLASALANVTAGRAVATSLGFGLANAAEAVVVAWLLVGRRRRRAGLGTMEDLWRLALATLGGTVVVGAGIGLTVALTLDGAFLTAAAAVMASHAAAVLVFAPLALVVPRMPLAGRSREVAVQCALLLGATGYIFAPGQVLSLTFLPLPASPASPPRPRSCRRS